MKAALCVLICASSKDRQLVSMDHVFTAGSRAPLQRAPAAACSPPSPVAAAIAEAARLREQQQRQQQQGQEQQRQQQRAPPVPLAQPPQGGAAFTFGAFTAPPQGGATFAATAAAYLVQAQRQLEGQLEYAFWLERARQVPDLHAVSMGICRQPVSDVAVARLAPVIAILAPVVATRSASGPQVHIHLAMPHRLMCRPLPCAHCWAPGCPSQLH